MLKTLEIYDCELHLISSKYFTRCKDCIAANNEKLCNEISCLNCDSTSVYSCGATSNTVWKPIDPAAFNLALLLHGE